MHWKSCYNTIEKQYNAKFNRNKKVHYGNQGYSDQNS